MLFKPALLCVLSLILLILPGQSESKISDNPRSLEHESIEMKVEACRVALSRIQKHRTDALSMGKESFFDELFFNAQEILDSIQNVHSSDEMNYLLGQCQGILDSLVLVLNTEKYRSKKNTSDYGAAPTHYQTAMDRNQAVSRPNGVKREPLPPLENEKEEGHLLSSPPEVYTHGSHKESSLDSFDHEG